MALNESYPFRKPNNEATCTATAAITGKRFVAISAAPTAIGDNPKVAPATAGLVGYGVAAGDAASGSTEVLVHTGPGMEVPVTASGSITFNTEVEIVGTGANAGKVQTLASGKAVGYAVSSAADGADVRIKLYR
jgi:hypothetical protein